MAQYRALARIMMVPYVLKRFNKSEGLKLKQSTLHLLISVLKLPSPSGCTRREISQLLEDNLRTASPNTIISGLKYLTELGYVDQQKISGTNRYKITLEGKNALMELERRLRRVRLPRQK